MSMTRFPHGLSSHGIPVYGNGVGPLFGPGCGKIVWMVSAKNEATDAYYKWLHDNGVSDNEIYTTLATAYAATTGSRNDVIAVFPGAYDATATLDWTKDNTHLVGLGGPNTRADYSEKNVVLYTDTTQVDYTIHLTGDHCVFLNIGINNAGNHANNYSPLYVDGYGNYFENVTLIGNMAANQLADDDCASLHIGTNAHNCKWINCDIGEDCWGARSAAYSGQVSFIGSQPNGGLFRNCIFRSQSATATVAMITTYKGAAGASHVGRGWVFDNCIFNNWNITNTDCNEVFNGDTTGWLRIQLHNCSAYGYHEWSDQDTAQIVGTMPEAVDGGGLAKQLTDAVA